MPQASRCPRCQLGFNCGAEHIATCACRSVGLSATLRSRLADNYRRCLCVGCLTELARLEAQDDVPAPSGSAQPTTS